MKTPWFGIKLHHLVKSDSPHRGLHDHPWSFLSIRIIGNYSEVRPSTDYTGELERHRFYSFRRATDQHQVIVDNEAKGCWTLVINGPRVREWGFVGGVDGEDWVPHYESSGPRLRRRIK